MFTEKRIKEYYHALLNKNKAYEGLFFVGVKTTGIFCRPTCPARKPKVENCEFFETAQEALLASFRPSAFRAVALANGANQFAIVIPCHRVINSNGDLGGYGGGIKRKEWFLKHERK